MTPCPPPPVAVIVTSERLTFVPDPVEKTPFAPDPLVVTVPPMIFTVLPVVASTPAFSP